MTDYLGNLLARSFAPPEQGVRPRTPSMFEPAAPSVLPGGFLESAAEGESSGESQHPDARLTRPAKDSPTESRNASTSPTPRDRPAESATPPTGAHLSIPVAKASTASATLEKPSLVPRAENAPISLDRPPIGPGSAAPHDSTLNMPAANPVRPAVPAGEKKTAASSPALPVAPLSPPEPDTTRRDNRRPTVEPQRSTLAPPFLRPVEPPPSGIAAHRSRTERVPASIMPKQAVRAEKKSEVPPVTTATPPTIQVTIGRVEVRATTSATPQRPKSKKEPEMSLEAYLARRAEGEFR
jgi:hypothetical protein